MITLCDKCDYYRSCYDEPEFCYTHKLLQKIESLEYRNTMLVETLAEIDNPITIEIGDMVKSITSNEDSFVRRYTTGLVLKSRKQEDGSMVLFVQWEDSKVENSDHKWYINSKDVVKL